VRWAATLAGQAAAFGLMPSVSRHNSGDYPDGGGNTLAFTESDVLSGLVRASWRADQEQRLSLTYLGFVDDGPSLSTAGRPTGLNVDRSTRQQSGSLRYQLDPVGELVALAAVAYWSDLMFDERPVATGQTREERRVSTIYQHYSFRQRRRRSRRGTGTGAGLATGRFPRPLFCREIAGRRSRTGHSAREYSRRRSRTTG